MRKTLIIMAAGMGSRYWWLKQVDWFWPNWEAILEYSIYDAIKAWCEHVVIVIQPQFEELFEEKFWNKFSTLCDVTYVYQEKTTLIPDSLDISGREKPRGSAHAILVCKHVVDWPFIVINADDWYGREGYWLLYNKLDEIEDNDFAMVGYPIINTIPKEWTVNRGICSIDNWTVVWIEEQHSIWYTWEQLSSKESDFVSKESVVSMNFWWYKPWIFRFLQEEFDVFLETYWTEPKKEFYISTSCNTYLENKLWICHVVVSWDQRSWVTNKEDKPILQAFIKQKIEEGYYPKKLWKN